MQRLSYTSVVGMSGGSPTQWRSTSLDSLTLQPENVFIQSSDGNADRAGHIGAPAAGGSGEGHSGAPNMGRFNFATSDQGTVHGLEPFEDAPYVPPRVPQAELQAYPALHPRGSNLYYDPPNHNIQLQGYPCEGSPAESHHSVGSNWSTPSSSSSSSPQRRHDFLESPSQHSQPSVPLRPATHPHYPAYYGQHRLGLEYVRYGEQPSNSSGYYYRTPQGHSTDGLLSPEVIDDTHAPVAIPSRETSQRFSSSASPVPATNRHPNISTFSASPTGDQRTSFPDAGPYLRKQLGLSGDEPISLYALPDPPPGERPTTPLPILIKLAIYGSPHKQLTLQEIYSELQNRFQWFREHKHQRAWKNSIRHNLSLNKVFRNVPRPYTEPGKGSYWQLDVSGGEGYKRPRKRRPKSKTTASDEEEEEGSEMDEVHTSPLDPSQHAGPSRSTASPSEDAHIDPELRSEGHVVVDGRTRSATRRGIQYPPQPPHIQQGPLTMVTGQDASVLRQSTTPSGQPSFGQSSFPTYPQARLVQATPNASFPTLTSSSTVACLQAQHVTSYDQAVPMPQPSSQLGVEYVINPEGLQAAQPTNMYSQSQGNVMRLSPNSSSSGSSWAGSDARSRSFTQDDR